MTDERLDRSEETARSAVSAAWSRVREAVADRRVVEVLDDATLDEILRLAWRHQFDEARGRVRTELKEIIGDRVGEVIDAEAARET